MGQINTEKIDPLIRIQEEIKEVVRREEEHRQLTNGSSPISVSAYEVPNENGITNNSDSHIDKDSTNSLSISPVPRSSLNNFGGSLNVKSLAHNENDVISKESIDDDSGISASPSPVNGISASLNHMEPLKTINNFVSKEQRYVGPNCYTITPEPPRQMMIANTATAINPTANKQRPFAFNTTRKGIMQRFIASRGKLQLSNNNTTSNNIFFHTKTAANSAPNTLFVAPSSSINGTSAPDVLTSSIALTTVTMSSPIIERDAEGRVIRRGYVPADLKIKREIKDLKAREHELKKRNKFRQSSADLLDSIGNEDEETDDEDSEVEHCYGPRQLRSAKSVSEIYCSIQLNNSTSPRESPSPDFDVKLTGISTMRPAMSLAQLCDLNPEETPSPHRLIAEWESRIQRNATRNTSVPTKEE